MMMMSQTDDPVIRCKCGADLSADDIIERHIRADGAYYTRYRCACGRVVDVPERTDNEISKS